jgi:two-component SAPR family response regulator
MPQMGGKALAEQVREFSPNIRILFTSGYAEGSIVHQGVFIKGTVFRIRLKGYTTKLSGISPM